MTMGCLRFSLGKTTGIMTFANESEPFFYRGKRFVVNKMFGPIAVNRHGDPLDKQPSGRMLQGAFEHFERQRLQRPASAEPRCPGGCTMKDGQHEQWCIGYKPASAEGEG